MKSILVIEDDLTINKNITEALQNEHYQVTCAYDGYIAEKLLRKNTYDCIVLDINIPHKNGYEICRQFRSYNTHTPLIMLTAFDELEDKVQGFESGADDYITKPFYIRELVLRIQTCLKRQESIGTSAATSSILKADDIIVNLESKTVTRNNTDITLTPREFQILIKLIEKDGDYVSKQELIQEIWGNIVDANTNTIEVYINFLRNKLDKPFQKNTIKTKVGYGYYIDIQ
ncbi:MAG TPA: response regulator transcription factor [Fluviicola sp.]|nr:response regulator transcription factor [Fluviicola sp.]